MKTKLGALLLAATMASAAVAAGPAANPVEPDAALVDAIVRKLESSGALDARKEALAAECVAQLGGNDAYWKYADALFANTKSNGGALPEDKSVEKLAETIGVKSAALVTCMNDGSVVKRVEQDIADGNAAGVSGTPTTVVRNNRTGTSEAVVGALPSGGLEPAIERMLNAKP